jgi:predicted PurR-regulated permease PerM
VGLSPLVVILAALIGFKLGGFWGLVLAIPVSVFVMEFLGDLEKKKIAHRTNNESGSSKKDEKK